MEVFAVGDFVEVRRDLSSSQYYDGVVDSVHDNNGEYSYTIAFDDGIKAGEVAYQRRVSGVVLQQWSNEKIPGRQVKKVNFRGPNILKDVSPCQHPFLELWMPEDKFHCCDCKVVVERDKEHICFSTYSTARQRSL